MPRLTCKQLILGVRREVEIFSTELDKPHLHPRAGRQICQAGPQEHLR